MTVKMTRKQRGERWGGACAPELLLASSPFGFVDGREDFRGFHWEGTFSEHGISTDVFLPPGQVLDNIDFSYANINPFIARELTMRHCYAKQATFTSTDWAHGTISDCEFERCKFASGFKMPLIVATVTDCVFRSCTFPELFAYGTRYDRCQALNMRLTGPKGGNDRYPLITNTTVTGKWKEFTVEETIDGTQLSGCDFSEVEFGICTFEYLDMNKVKIPDDIKQFTVTNWETICDDIRTQLQNLHDASSLGEEPYKQTSFALHMLQDDLRGYHEQVSRPRGARYCVELTFATRRGHKHDYLLDLYRDAGATFMLDPTPQPQEKQ